MRFVKGRKPKPTHLKVLQGNPGRRPLPADEPKLASCFPDPPSHLSEAARQHWAEVGGMLHEAGILTALDADALAAYCELHARWVEANEKIREYGLVIKSPSGAPVQSPYFKISAITFDAMKALLVEFGMTPSSRARVKSTKPKEVENPFAAIDRLRGA